MQLKNSTKLAFYGILTVLAVMLFIAATYVNYNNVQDHRSRVLNETRNYLSHYHNRLLSSLQGYIQIVKSLPGLFVINPDLSQEQYCHAVARLLESAPEIRNIAAAPDMVIRYIYPVEGNEAAIGLDYRKEPAQFEAVDRARRTGNLVLAGPVDLRQGGSGLIIRIPVFLPRDGLAEDVFWGVISAIIDTNRFFEKNGLFDKAMPVRLAIRGTDSLGRQGAVFYGDPALFSDQSLTQTLKLPEGEWLLAAAPLDGWAQLPSDFGQQRILIYGAAVILFLLLALFIRFIFAASLANTKFHNLIESSPVPYMLLNQNRQITFINQAFTETYGYDLEAIQSMNSWWEMTTAPESYREAFKVYLERHPSKSEAVSDAVEPMEIELLTQNHQRKVALLSISILQSAPAQEILLVIYDITVRKEAEEQLRFSSRVFNQAHEGIILTDIDGTITDVNPAFCDITGYSREEVIGHEPHILNSGKHSPEFFSKMWSSIIEHGYWQGEVWNRRKNGELYAELLTVSALKDDDGQSRHFVGIFFRYYADQATAGNPGAYGTLRCVDQAAQPRTVCRSILTGRCSQQAQ